MQSLIDIGTAAAASNPGPLGRGGEQVRSAVGWCAPSFIYCLTPLGSSGSPRIVQVVPVLAAESAVPRKGPETVVPVGPRANPTTMPSTQANDDRLWRARHVDLLCRFSRMHVV